MLNDVLQEGEASQNIAQKSTIVCRVLLIRERSLGHVSLNRMQHQKQGGLRVAVNHHCIREVRMGTARIL